MKTDVIGVELRNTLRKVSQEREALERIETTLKKVVEEMEGGESKPKAPAAVQGKKRKKSPHGALEKAICQVLENGKKMTNSEIRAALKLWGYSYSLSSAHVSQTLGIMKKAGRIIGEGQRNVLKYALPG